MNDAWTWRPLGEVTMPTFKWNPRADVRPSIRYVDVSGVSRDDLRIVTTSEYASADAPGRARKIVKKGDTIFATVRPTLRRVAQVPECLNGEVVSTAFCVLRPNPDLIHPDFLFFAMQMDGVMDEVASTQTGASYPAVRDLDVLSLTVPVPPISVQRRIATALNLVRSAILRQRGCGEAATALKRAAMLTLFTCGLRGEAQKETEIGPVPESWVVKPIYDCFDVVSGGTPSRRVQEFWMDGTIPWVKTTEVDYCVIRKTDEYITRAGLEQSAAKVLPPGTLLLAMYGQGVTRGKVAILGIEATCNQACAAITPNDGVVDSKFLYHFLLFRYESIRQLAHGGQQQNLNLEIVRNLPIPIPPDKDLQGDVVAILDAIDRKIDLHRRKRTVLEELFKAFLQKLMTGEMQVGDLNCSELNEGFTTAEDEK